jgi:hypothetical protein
MGRNMIEEPLLAQTKAAIHDRISELDLLETAPAVKYL